MRRSDNSTFPFESDLRKNIVWEPWDRNLRAEPSKGHPEECILRWKAYERLYARSPYGRMPMGTHLRVDMGLLERVLDEAKCLVLSSTHSLQLKLQLLSSWRGDG